MTLVSLLRRSGTGLLWLMVSFLDTRGDPGPPTAYDIRQPAFQTYTFEENLPVDFSASSGGVVDLTDRNFHTGTRSLKWTWDAPGSVLSYRNPEAFAHLTGENPDPIIYDWVTATTLSTLRLWVYNPVPAQDALWFELGTADRTDARFWMTLDFQGWRELRFIYGRDLPGFPGPDADTLRIIAPASRAAGTLYFDDFAPRVENDVRFVRGTPQLPWVCNPDVSPSTLDPLDYLRNGTGVEDRSEVFEIEVPDKLDEAALADLSTLRERWLGDLPLREPFDPDPEQLQRMEAAYAAFGFSRSPEGLLNGNLVGGIAIWGHAETVCRAYHGCTDPKVKARLDAMLGDYIDFLIQHGKGSGYRIRNAFVRPLWTMKDDFKRYGKWDAMLEHMRGAVNLWLMRTANAWNEDDIRKHPLPPASEAAKTLLWSSADVLNHTLTSWVHVILLQDDPVAVFRDLKTLQAWLTALAEREGPIKPDGSLHHHGQTYSGYNLPALPPLVKVIRLLDGTRFASPEIHRMVRRVAMGFHIYSCTVDIPATLSGRHQSKVSMAWGFVQDTYGSLAQLAPPADTPFVSRPAGWEREVVPDLPGNIDREMAEIYLYYARHYNRTNDLTERLLGIGLHPDDPAGHLSMNHTVAAIHRREDWMVMFRGQRSPYISGENYQGSTAPMSRYLNFGLMEIVCSGAPPNILESSLGIYPKGTEAGWDFNHYPGTTARVLPNHALTSHFPIEERITSETFALGTHLDGNGVFGMKLREDLPGDPDPRRIGPVRYWLGETKYRQLLRDARFDPDFRARKSVFFFDDRIVCLGSGIRSRDPDAPVRTTLFQHLLTPAAKSARPFPDQRMIAEGDAGVLIDRNGNGYYIAPGNNLCTYTRAHRDLPYIFKWNPLVPEEEKTIYENSGDTELAFLDHGAAPEGAGYEYCVLIRPGGLQRMEQFSQAMADPQRRYYDVLQRDDSAHIVHDRITQNTGYVFFEPGSRNADHRSPILFTSSPCVAMTRSTLDGHLAISVCEPSIGQDDVLVELVLAGAWRIDAPGTIATAVASHGRTRLRVPCRDALPVRLTLRPEIP